MVGSSTDDEGVSLQEWKRLLVLSSSLSLAYCECLPDVGVEERTSWLPRRA